MVLLNPVSRIPHGRADEDRLVADMTELARQYGRYGYRRIAALLRVAGWQVNDKRVERLWRREGLKVPEKQPKRDRLWLNDGSCIRLRAERADHVWSYDFVHHQTHDGRAFRMLNVLDEFTRESLAIRVRRKLSSVDVIDVLTDLFILRGIPAWIRSDNGPEFVAEAVRRWIAAVGARTAFIEPGSPWENGYIESFNARLRDEFLNGEIFYTLKEAQVLIETWRCHYNAIRPHSSLGYRPPAPETVVLPSWPPGSLTKRKPTMAALRAAGGRGPLELCMAPLSAPAENPLHHLLGHQLASTPGAGAQSRPDRFARVQERSPRCDTVVRPRGRPTRPPTRLSASPGPYRGSSSGTPSPRACPPRPGRSPGSTGRAPQPAARIY